MNNEQFRKLIASNSQKKHASAGSPPASRPSATPALGSRKQSSIPMTPRQVGDRSSVNAEFARQLAERNAKANPKKKFKSTAPKGVKLAAGYVDRTKVRVDDEEDETAKRIKALEEAMKLGLINRETFENMVQEITGGDIAATHLVKGLDRKLLERVKRGEPLQSANSNGDGEDPDSEVEAEFDELAEHEIAPVVKEKVEKKGEMAPPAPVAGVKRSRDAILAELKAQRKAAAEAAAAEHEKKYPSLGPGFRKLGQGSEGTRLEVDSQGREVLIITDAEGKEKRKVRKRKVEEPQPEPQHAPEVEKQPEQVGAGSPLTPSKEESDDDDIFAGVGANYNPLADMDDGDDDASSDEEPVQHRSPEAAKPASVHSEDEGEASPKPGTSQLAETKEKSLHTSDEASPQAKPPGKAPPGLSRRNYFNDDPLSATKKETHAADATVLAALKKVRTLDANSSLLQDTEEARLKKRATELAATDRDMEDLDMGFGESRFDDADEMEREGEKVKFSEWRGLGAEDEDDEEGQGRRGEKKRKRGPKKKKGDKNSVADVLQVMERQKGSKPLG